MRGRDARRRRRGRAEGERHLIIAHAPRGFGALFESTVLFKHQLQLFFLNEEESPGLKKGGVLNVVRHELELVCDNDKIPGEIEIDVTGKEVGDSIHISEVALPEGSESAITDRDFTIATLVAPSALKKAEGDTTQEGDEVEETEVTEQHAETVEGEADQSAD